jgi:predicted lipid-binding transport protein (Tim44 family)
MTSSYGYQRPLSGEEELYLQNQALRAELQRRDDAKQGLREAVGGGLATGLGLGAVAAGAIGLASALSPAQRAKISRNLSSTVDLSKEAAADLRRAAAARLAPQEVVPASRPAPATSAERLQRIEEDTRRS